MSSASNSSEKKFSLSKPSPRSGRRSTSNKLASPVFVRKSNRKSAGHLATTKARSIRRSEDDEIEDSWDYGSGNVHFLELLSREMLKESKPVRSFSPENEEIKQNIRSLHEKLSLSPRNAKVFAFGQALLPIIKISPAETSSKPQKYDVSGQFSSRSTKGSLTEAQSAIPIHPMLTKSVLSTRSAKNLRLQRK
jgi:hypothetical protein